MPSNHTTNYQLSQWAKSDQVLMEDFNADNAKLDTALKAEANTRAAAVNAINATLSGMVRLKAGSYTGDGAATRTISVGFTPKAVFVILVSGYTYAFGDGNFLSAAYGGLAVTDCPAGGASDYPVVKIVPGGFQVSYRNDRPTSRSNQQNEKYNYIALG